MKSNAATSGDRRIVGLDVWRAALLLGGPINHAAFIVATFFNVNPLPWLVVQWGTHLFRMQAFFFISGIVSARASERRSQWIWRRLVQLILPLASTWALVLAPLAWFRNHMGLGHPLYTDPDYLWFLIVLIVATVTASLLERPMAAVARSLDRWSLGRVAGWWCIVAVVVAASTPIIEHQMSAHQFRADLITRTYRYGAFYLAGSVFSRCAALNNSVRTTRLWVIGPIAWVAMLVLFWSVRRFVVLPGDTLLARVLVEATVALVSVPMCLCVVHTAFRIRRIPSLVWQLSRSSFTIYLVHFPILFLLVALPGMRQSSPAVFFLLSSYTCLVVSLVVHKELARFAWFRLAFNGHIGSKAEKLIPFTNRSAVPS